jgi:hypothetical protein
MVGIKVGRAYVGFGVGTNVEVELGCGVVVEDGIFVSVAMIVG